MSVKAVVFDLDDTLYPERDYVLSGFAVVGATLEEKYGITDATNKLTQLFLQDRKNVYGRVFERDGVDYSQKDIDYLADIYRKHKPMLTVPYQSAKTLADLRKKGYLLGIISDGRPYQQRAKINSLGLDNAVDAIIVTDELGGENMRKHNPAAFIKMADLLNVNVEEIGYVGDNPNKDFAVKKHLPLKTVEIKSKGIYNCGEYLDGIAPDVTVNCINEVARAVENLS